MLFFLSFMKFPITRVFVLNPQLAGTAVAGQVGITASPIAAAMAAMIGLFAQNGHGDIGLGQILMITFPACLIGVILGSIICVFFGKDLKNDPGLSSSS